MVIAQKCNCCMAEKICKYKEVYEKAVLQIRDSYLSDFGGAQVRTRESAFLDVSIKCPYMILPSTTSKGDIAP